MKKLLIINMIAGLFLVSCDTEVKDLFDDSAAVRVQKSMDECFDLLTSAENGWVMEYYPNENLYYGGYNYLVKFDKDGFVTVAFELADDYSEKIESHFSINASAGAVLTFDTYNEYIHFFSDPDPGAGSTFGGDFEFTYVSGTRTEMEFKGTKTGNRIMLRALDAGQDWTEYFEKIEELQAEIIEEFFIEYVYDEGGVNEVSFIQDNNYNYFTYPDPEDELGYAQLEAPFIYTPTGIRFYEPLDFGGTTAQTFDWNEDIGGYVSTDGGNTVTLVGKVSENYVPYDFYLGSWQLDYTDNATQQPVTKTVQLVEKERYKSYSLVGLSNTFDFEVEWNLSTGNLSMLGQLLGMWNGYYAYFVPWDGDEGYIVFNGFTIGFDLKYENREAATTEILFRDNGVWGTYTVNCITINAFTSTNQSAATNVGWIERYLYPERLYR